MKSTAVLLAALCGLAASAHAQNIKPGLWEFKQTPQLDPERQAQIAQAQKAMENMPPAQRQMMEQMMAQRGISMNLAGGTITVKTCVTKEQAERNMAPVSQHGRCTQDVKRSGNTIQTHFVCTDPVSEGDAVVTLKGSEGFTNDITVRHERQGKSETMKVSGEGRWLGADCGEIQPMKSQVK
ncbi:MAG: DUF3617 domain-containing protein [Proteobacteria bacterium]|jgi:hypothetical protein|nr:DUF3617 domain-containing protein [Burkholderiaceae bacterium]MCH8856809.1 DUF3617 domain-containing protein [Pseudomonadota bacterium]|mmetsp:Transcript_70428/g.165815  ORF Transcript_70428/g.165815 Transcript_70428/m.165815 type:complete len:182 (+) Transcript_70428:919-1464(+)